MQLIKKTLALLRRAVLPAMAILALSAAVAGLPGVSRSAEEEWTDRELGWLLALTYPEHSPVDFGLETIEPDRELLRRFSPRVIVSRDGLLPVDFYGFYLPNTVVRDLKNGGGVVKRGPSREFLKGIEREKRYYLDYTGPLRPCGQECGSYVGTAYGRVYRETARLRTGKGVKEVPITVLKYGFAFPFSGLPARLGPLREAAVRIAADPVRFHELDIHGAIQIILNEDGRPMALLLAQHNHSRTYVIGKDVELPADGKIRVCFAERSNEPYPCRDGQRLYRAVGNPLHMAYVIDGRKRPFTSGLDMVRGPGSGGVEVPYELKFLPSRDPLYVSWIPLGAREKIFFFFSSFYRKGPPGMDLNTWAGLKEYGEMMQFWYLRDGEAEDAALMEGAFKSFFEVDFGRVLEKNGARLFKDLSRHGHIDAGR
jgi:hypothetical protein